MADRPPAGPAEAVDRIRSAAAALEHAMAQRMASAAANLEAALRGFSRILIALAAQRDRHEALQRLPRHAHPSLDARRVRAALRARRR